MADTGDMRQYWDDAAKRNAAWYVDTSMSYGSPDMDRFFETGRTIADIALDGPVAPARRRLAVEIGPGLGRICRALATDHGFERVVGIDISAEMVKRARELVAEPGVEFLVGDGASLEPIVDASADLVVTFTVFQHIPRVRVIEQYVAEAGRILRPGGVFAFQWNNTPGHRRWIARRAVLSALQSTGLKPERHSRHAPQFLGSRVPLRRIEQALTAAGLRLRGTRELDTLYAWAWADKP